MYRVLKSAGRAGIAAAAVALLAPVSIQVLAEPVARAMTVLSDDAPSCSGGLVAGDVFAGNGEPGQVVRTTDGGNTFISPWVVLPEATTSVMAAVRDQSCAFGGDLLVVTGGATPTVWRVTAAGASSMVIALNTPVAGLVSVPNDTAKYGPMAGRILTAGADRIFAIDAGGGVLTIGPGGDYSTTMPLTVEQLEEQPDSVHPCGDVLVRQPPPDDESSGLSTLLWSGTEFVVSLVADPDSCR